MSKCMLRPLLEVPVSKNGTLLWREACSQVKMHKTHHVRTTCGRPDVKNLHAAAAGSTFSIQNVQSTPFSEQFWKIRRRKSARHCGPEHMSKSECSEHTISGPFLEDQMPKKWTPLRREAHFPVR